MYDAITSQINYSISPWINHPCNQPHMSQSITVDSAQASDFFLLTPFCPSAIPTDKRDGRNTVEAVSDVPAYRVAWGQFSSLLPCSYSILLWPAFDTFMAFPVCQVCACNSNVASRSLVFEWDAVLEHLARAQIKVWQDESYRCYIADSGDDQMFFFSFLFCLPRPPGELQRWDDVKIEMIGQREDTHVLYLQEAMREESGGEGDQGNVFSLSELKKRNTECINCLFTRKLSHSLQPCK